MAGPGRVRTARIADLDTLIALEHRVFAGDRLSRRAMRHAVLSPAQVVLVVVAGGEMCGAIITGFRSGATVARISSLAVFPAAAGQGFGRQLVGAAERAAAARGATRMRLEVRADNGRAAALYEALGYRRFGRHADYYEDGGDALRYEKILR